MKKSSSKTWVASLIFFIILIVFLGIGYLYIQKSTVAAVVGGKNISKTDYESRKEKEKKFIEFAYTGEEKKDKLNSVGKDSLDKMIEEEILSQKAAELGVSATDEEIKNREKKIISSYENEDEYLNILSSIYSTERKNVLDNIKYRVLRDKVSGKVTDKRSVSYIYVRYDLTGQENNDAATQESVAALAEAKINSLVQEMKQNGFDKVAVSANNYAGTDLVVGSDTYEQISSDSGLPQEDVDAIWNLGKESDISGQVKSSGGYYVIYKLDKMTGGAYKNYDEFLKQAKKDKKVRVYVPEAAGKSGIIEEFKTVIFGQAEAAGCSTCGNTVGVKWYGYVTDSVTGNKLPGVSLAVENQSGGVSCLDSTTGHGWCGKKSGTTASDTGGYYQFGRTDGTNVFVNCGWNADWKLTATKSGYNTHVSYHDIKGKNGSIYSYNIELAAASWDNLGATLSVDPQVLEVDYYINKSATFTAHLNHDRGPDSHGIQKYEWDLNGDGVYELVNNSGVVTQSYGWINTPEKKIVANVRVTCAKGKTATASTTLTLKRPEHKIVCKTLNASPKVGIVPLSVKFTASVYDTWGFPITKYDWDFNGDNTWDSTTDLNSIEYTYIDKGGYTARARGYNNQNVPSENCPISTLIDSGLWSESQWWEVAP